VSGLKRAEDYTQFTLDGLRKGGMTVQKASPQLRSDLMKIGETMTQEWLKDAGAEGKAIVDKFKSM
jgi:TRAP-type C4-dicarboxylate transport system substrate-binding protein